MKSSEQIKALIRNKSKTLNISSNIIVRSVIFEFFLEKLAKSNYVDKFIIKGGFLVSAVTEIDFRTTMDLDVTLKSLSINKENIAKIIQDIIMISTNDKLKMKLTGIDEFQEDANYPGLRVSLRVNFDGLKESIKIDFTTGDILTPCEIDFIYETILDKRKLQLKSYNLETLLAEKIETILSRGVLNTRMRDFYDIFILKKIKITEINMDVLKLALLNTTKYRRTFDQVMTNIDKIFNSIQQDSRLQKRWTSYQSSYPYAKDIEWREVMDSLKEILELIK